MSIDTGVRAHRFMVGTMVCTIVSDGSLAYQAPAHLFFVNAPQAERDSVLRAAGIEPDTWHEYVSPHCALLVDTRGQRVLVDTGGGGFAPTNGKLHENLRAEGIGLDSVDVVVLTHAHADHIGGNLNAQQEPAFPNARYVTWRDEWDSGPTRRTSQACPFLTRARYRSSPWQSATCHRLSANST